MTLVRVFTAILLAATLAACGERASPPVVSDGADSKAGKVLRLTFQVAETGFDPVKVSDYYSGLVISAIFDSLLTYDYLARPAKLKPNIATALPRITDDGKTYTLTLQQGVYFTPDPAFKGLPHNRRELIAADYVYSIKRFLDPKNRSPYAFLFEGKIVGLDKLAEAAKKSGRFDYDAVVAGLEAPDRYTLRIRLTEADFNFSHVLAFSLVGAVAREAIEAYGDDTNAHPVGTGPYRLQRYMPSSKIVLEKNPGVRDMFWHAEPGDNAADLQIATRMEGKKLPQIDRVEISVMDEAQSRWLAFQRRETDIEYQLEELAPKFMTMDGKLKPEYAGQGIRMERSVDAEIIYLFFNTQEKIGDKPNPLGGFTPEKIALRRAVAMAYNIEDQIKIIRKGQAIRAYYPIPPGVAGHEPQYRNSIAYDPRLANALLDKFGYRRSADGYRQQPDGKYLILKYYSSPSERDRQFDELMKRSLDAIGVRVEIHKDRFAELIKLANQCRLMMKHATWIADYPDGDNFMQLLYGPNTGQTNSACYRSSAFDARYEKSRRMPDSAQRNQLYREMTRQMEVDTAWLLTDSRYRNVLLQPYVIGYKKSAVNAAEWMYMDIGAKEPR
ncbi:MAG TPA: ABC transporter substrate-binding protein [Burkholderiales bacterium]|nr:ABC transporter substrate-binding protein [Burkholderiales bacterium]